MLKNNHLLKDEVSELEAVTAFFMSSLINVSDQTVLMKISDSTDVDVQDKPLLELPGILHCSERLPMIKQPFKADNIITLAEALSSFEIISNSTDESKAQTKCNSNNESRDETKCEQHNETFEYSNQPSLSLIQVDTDLDVHEAQG